MNTNANVDTNANANVAILPPSPVALLNDHCRLFSPHGYLIGYVKLSDANADAIGQLIDLGYTISGDYTITVKGVDRHDH